MEFIISEYPLRLPFGHFISIEYLYSYSRTGGNAIILFKVKEVGRALDVLSRADVRVLDKAL